MHPQGSVWRKWDLHVHTPQSLKEKYAGPDKWETFMQAIEALPPEFEVIGINDYLFIDGFKRVLDEWKNGTGRMRNIRLFLPVIELRIDKFGGTAHDLKRVNFHVIFSDKLDVETIEDQFLRALRSKYTLSPEYEGIAEAIRWNGSPTMKSLADLGTAIIDAAPSTEKHKYLTPLEEGFNNLNFSLEAIYEALGSNYFESKYVTAVGKTEWSAMQWNSETIAEKRNVINKAHLVFTSGYTPEGCIKSRDSLAAGTVNSRLLDCSDAHCVMAIPPPGGELEKDRIGKCFTWIKAEPTFEGLKQAVYEYDSRVRLAETQPLEPFLQIKKVTLGFPEDTKLVREGVEEDFCFRGKYEIPFSPFTTCIIGGRGSGKSTLLHLLSERLSPSSSAFFAENKLKPDTLQTAVDVDGIVQTGIVEFLPQNKIERFASDYRQLTSAILERLRKLDTGGTLTAAEDNIAAAVKATKDQIARLEEHYRLSTRITANEAELKTQRTLVDSFTTLEYTTINADLTALSKEARALKTSKARLDQIVTALELALSERVVPAGTETNAYEDAATALTTGVKAAVAQAKNAPELVAAAQKEHDLATKIIARRTDLDTFLKARGLSAENLADVGRASERIAQLEDELASAKEKVAQLKIGMDAFASQKAAADEFTMAVNALLKPINADLKNLSTEVKPIELRYDFDCIQCQQHLVKVVADALGSLNPDARFRIDHINSMLEDVDCLALTNLEETLAAIPAEKATGKALRDYLSQGVRFEVLKLNAEIALMDVATHGRIHVLYDGRPVEKSSFGQRCTATIVVLLRLGNTPLIVDEPEAHLDSALIAKYLVELVKQRKQHRQVIFASKREAERLLTRVS